ncbi:MAG: hypothetical protein AAB451_00095 [Patescibacteria group bacterium]
MSYPLIILGAGASFDYIREDLIRDPLAHNFRPPLTDKLFRTNLLKGIVEEYPVLNNLIASAEAAMQHGKNLEEYLSEIKLKNIERQCQIVAMQFYLQKFFQEISDKYYQIGNNYSALVSAIQDTEKGEACIVTFDYDSLFEKALNFPIEREIDDYIKGPIKLIKAHGSCDWVRIIKDEWRDIEKVYKSSYNFLIKDPTYLKDQFKNKNRQIYIRRDYKETRQYSASDARVIHYHPEVAVPLADKDDSFVCPDSHINVVINALSEVDRILIVGWKAGDASFIKLMAENIKNPVKLTIVAGSQSASRDIYKRISHIANLSPEFSSSTFSSFVGDDMYKKFFSY